MQEQQKPIADWMRSVMEAKGLKATNWAVKAKLGRDTVSRAVKEEYKHVTSTTTLIKLAKAAGVPAPLHLGTSARGVPQAHVLAEIISELLERLVPDREWPEEMVQALGKALRHTLLEIAEDGDDHRMAARIAARAQLDEGSRPRGLQK